ncbi:response regulator [Flavisolibacter nicotianae]|uniref:response regulator n=1 Tax=Flavisolibacter nicotianae TaxID=2364882 RepID=UPI000EB38790|nr:response regulator [Flavisolibacter nicotianae]
MMKTKTPKQRTILWADDDPDDRHIICDIVAAHYSNYALTCVEDGSEVLRFLHNIKDTADLPCLVVLDINMPKLTGLETLERIKGDERYKDLKVAVFTTSSSKQDRQVCERHGVPMATKPYSYSDFKHAVAEMLQLCHVSNTI